MGLYKFITIRTIFLNWICGRNHAEWNCATSSYSEENVNNIWHYSMMTLCFKSTICQQGRTYNGGLCGSGPPAVPAGRSPGWGAAGLPWSWKLFVHFRAKEGPNVI